MVTVLFYGFPKGKCWLQYFSMVSPRENDGYSNFLWFSGGKVMVTVLFYGFPKGK
jgi:hypothetical protein